MKKQLFILICSIVCSSFLISEQIYAKTMNTREIKLKANREKEDVRSIPPIYAWQDSQTVYISFYNHPQIVSVTIMDMTGEVIVTNTYQSPLRISILVYTKGKYQIEIHADSKIFTGMFELK